MVTTILKRVLLAAIALTSFLVSSPSIAAPMSLRAYAAQNLRVATVAYRISTAAAADCADPEMVTGLLLHDLSSYDRAVRPAVSRAFSLVNGVGVMQIVRGSAADRAGLRIDDEIVGLNGWRVQDIAAVQRTGRSSRRVEAFKKDLQRALSSGPAQLTVRRNGSLRQIRLRGERGCGGEISLSSSRGLNAWSDGGRVVVTAGMMQFTWNDDELAFVVAHEMAHNILGHSRGSRRGIFGITFGGKRQELAADYAAVWLMTEAGYRAEGSISFLGAISRRYPVNLSLDHPGVGSRMKTVGVAIASVARSPIWTRAHPAPFAPTRYQSTRTIAANEHTSAGSSTEGTQIASAGSSGAEPIASA